MCVKKDGMPIRMPFSFAITCAINIFSTYSICFLLSVRLSTITEPFPLAPPPQSMSVHFSYTVYYTVYIYNVFKHT